jgi:hypothetical protein
MKIALSSLAFVFSSLIFSSAGSAQTQHYDGYFQSHYFHPLRQSLYTFDNAETINPTIEELNLDSGVKTPVLTVCDFCYVGDRLLIDDTAQHALVEITTNTDDSPVTVVQLWSLADKKMIGQTTGTLYRSMIQGDNVALFANVNGVPTPKVYSMTDFHPVFNVPFSLTTQEVENFIFSESGQKLTTFGSISTDAQHPACRATIYDLKTGAAILARDFTGEDCEYSPQYINQETELFIDSNLVWNVGTNTVRSLFNQIGNASDLQTTIPGKDFTYLAAQIYSYNFISLAVKVKANEPNSEYRFWHYAHGYTYPAGDFTLYVDEKTADWVKTNYEKVDLLRMSSDDRVYLDRVKYNSSEILAVPNENKLEIFNLAQQAWSPVLNIPSTLGNKILDFGRNAQGNAWAISEIYLFNSTMYEIKVADQTGKEICRQDWMISANNFGTPALVINENENTFLLSLPDDPTHAVRANFSDCQIKEKINFAVQWPGYVKGTAFAAGAKAILFSGEAGLSTQNNIALVDLKTGTLQQMASGISSYDFNAQTGLLTYASVNYENQTTTYNLKVMDVNSGQIWNLDDVVKTANFDNEIRVKMLNANQLVMSVQGETWVMNFRQNTVAQKIYTRSLDTFFAIDDQNLGFIEHFNGNFMRKAILAAPK